MRPRCSPPADSQPESLPVSNCDVPEGHTIHREARLQRKRFVGESLRVSSPQGRFSEGAGFLDGNALDAIEAWGKHLFYEWDNGAVLHVHLGLFGRFRFHASNPPPPTDGTRLAIEGTEGVLYLSGPTACDLIGPEERESIISGLGPDPLRDNGEVDPVSHVSEYLGRRTVPVAAALLDQSVIAGIGNVFRSEILYRRSIHPLIESRLVTRAQAGEIWEEAHAQLTAGERSGRIVTTDPEDVGLERRSEIGRGERTYVYKRSGQPCRRCGTEIERSETGGRKVWWCPSCQPRPEISRTRDGT